MSVKKVSFDVIPKDVLGELQVLSGTVKKEYLSIGKSFYEVYPTSAVILMESLAELVSILDELRVKKIKRIKEQLNEEQSKNFNPFKVMTNINDIITDSVAVGKLKGILPKILEGVAPEDVEEMTIGQLVDAFEKIIEINIETLPPSYRNQIKQKQKEMMTVNDSQEEGNKEEKSEEELAQESASKNP